MKRIAPLVAFLAALSLLAGYLFSKMSWIGRVGINLIHKNYKFFKVWWQGALVVFAILMVFLLIQWLVQQKARPAAARIVQLILLLLAVAGLYYTYQDFRHDITHRWLKERFHLGGYLFWIGWMSISLFFLFSRSRPKVGTAVAQKAPLK
jgi:hypothetical protein